MKTIFLGEEGNVGINGSIVMGANAYSPPGDSVNTHDSYFSGKKTLPVDAWIEVWDYAGGSSFRGFVGGDGEKKSLFTFFDSAVVGRDLKQGLMALIELAETVFAVSHLIICLDRSVPEDDARAFMKGLRWIGFELIKLDMWANAIDATSDKWLFLGMEI